MGDKQDNPASANQILLTPAGRRLLSLSELHVH